MDKMHGKLRIAAATPKVKVADVDANVDEIVKLCHGIAAKDTPSVIVFPELCITGYTCGDLFFQKVLIDGAERGIKRLCAQTADLPQTLVVGSPFACDNGLYDAAVVIRKGEILGIVPKSTLTPQEQRWFRSGQSSQLFQADNFSFRVEIGETPSSSEGADILVCPAASYEVAGKHEKRKAALSALKSAVVYCCNGYGESTDDLAWAGASLIYEDGRLLAENERFQRDSSWIIADLGAGSPAIVSEPMDRCREIFNIQTIALMSRLEHIHCDKCVIGVSGGLDSTLALLVICAAFDRLGYQRKNIYGLTMPCFGTSDRTHSNAWKLMEALGITADEINIADAVTQHFADIGQDPDKHDVTFENAQARERTQILMDLSNKVGGIVIGTGDLSEISLGWCTYNGDHMSMYGVNSGVPKTLMRSMVRQIAKGHPCEATLMDIVDTPVSPELVPGQATENTIGPYELHDFFLEKVISGEAPRSVLADAVEVFKGTYDSDVILKWLRTFYRRFFSQQFKRTCSPCGPKVLDISLSPRGDWQMPTDASSDLWLADLE